MFENLKEKESKKNSVIIFNIPKVGEKTEEKIKRQNYAVYKDILKKELQISISGGHSEIGQTRGKRGRKREEQITLGKNGISKKCEVIKNAEKIRY